MHDGPGDLFLLQLADRRGVGPVRWVLRLRIDILRRVVHKAVHQRDVRDGWTLWAGRIVSLQGVDRGRLLERRDVLRLCWVLLVDLWVPHLCPWSVRRRMQRLL